MAFVRHPTIWPRDDYPSRMKTVEKWKWRIRWAGRWTTTRIAMTEADIRREHPEAVRIDESRTLLELPTTEAEVQAGQRERRTP
jgi:hypothetical protein